MLETGHGRPCHWVWQSCVQFARIENATAIGMAVKARNPGALEMVLLLGFAIKAQKTHVLGMVLLLRFSINDDLT